MKTNQIASIYGTTLVLITFLISSFSLHAQTFRGSEKLTEPPKSFGALIYPVETRQQTIRINVDNPDRAMVHTVIVNEKGNVVHDEYDNRVASREYYDLSSLPVGNYTIMLSTRHDRIAKSFTIASSKAGYITMGDRPVPVTCEFQTRQQLVVKE